MRSSPGAADATFFHRAGWQQMIEDVFRHRTHFLYAERAERIDGVLPLAHVKSLLFGDALVSLPFAVYGGVAADTPEAAAALEERSAGAGADDSASTISSCATSRRGIPTGRRRISTSRSARRSCRMPKPTCSRSRASSGRWCARASRTGCASEIDATPDRFFALYADNVHRHGTPALPKRYFEALQRVFGADCEVLTVVDPDGRPVSSVL